MARVGADQYKASLKKDDVREMDFTGKPMKGLVYVEPGGLRNDSELKEWIELCTNFVESFSAEE